MWNGFSMAMFACTSCRDHEHLIQEMPETTLYQMLRAKPDWAFGERPFNRTIHITNCFLRTICIFSEQNPYTDRTCTF